MFHPNNLRDSFF